jgi:hypothetical protein
LDGCTLQNIYQYLSVLDQVCLSLSCKELFGLFGTILKHKEFEFPRLLLIRNPILCVNNPGVLRNQLLLRLENRRWAYCGKCLKLHPRMEFSRHSLRESALERTCTRYAGIADLCPCISLTIRDRDQLAKILKLPAKPAKTKCGFFEYDFLDTGKPSLGHCCEFKYGNWPSYDMRVILVLSLTETGQLYVLAQYTMSLLAPKDYIFAEPSFACPHLDLLSLIHKTTKDPPAYQSSLLSKPYNDLLSLVPGKKVLKVCSGCQTLITKHEMPSNQVGLWAIRNLGRCGWSRRCGWSTSRPWFDQCRLTGGSFWINDIYWRVYLVICEEKEKITDNLLQVAVAELVKNDKRPPHSVESLLPGTKKKVASKTTRSFKIL